MGKFVIINGGVMFSGLWSIIKGWLDEKTRNAIDILGSNYLEILQKDIDLDVLPTFLGGNNTADFSTASGPWDEYDLVDSTEPGAEVGVRRKDDPSGQNLWAKRYASSSKPQCHRFRSLGNKSLSL